MTDPDQAAREAAREWMWSADRETMARIDESAPRPAAVLGFAAGWLAGREAEAAQKWRPIAEAPKDGRHILVADFMRWGFGYFEGVATAWQGVVHWWGNPGEEGFYLSSGDNGTPVTWATHWQPLPPPPLASPAPKEE